MSRPKACSTGLKIRVRYCIVPGCRKRAAPSGYYCDAHLEAHRHAAGLSGASSRPAVEERTPWTWEGDESALIAAQKEKV